MINLSRFSQAIEINTPRFAGFVPEDLFSTEQVFGGQGISVRGDTGALMITISSSCTGKKYGWYRPPRPTSPRWRLPETGSRSCQAGHGNRWSVSILPAYLKKDTVVRWKGFTINSLKLGVCVADGA